jgi:hypothetical protein
MNHPEEKEPTQLTQPNTQEILSAMLANINHDTKEQNCKKITTKTNSLSPVQKPMSDSVPNLQTFKKPTMIIPTGTQVCPERRYVVNQDNYYITLDKDIEIQLDSPDTIICINGMMLHAIDPACYDEKQRVANVAAPAVCDGDLKKLQSFIVPKGTPYYVNDSVKDPVGLLHSFEADERVRIRQGSTVYLPEGTEVVLYDAVAPVPILPDANKPVPNNVHMILKNRTKCTI